MDARTVEEGLKAKWTYEEVVKKAKDLVRHHSWPLKYLPAVSRPWARIIAPFAVTGSEDILRGCKLLVDGKCMGTFPDPELSSNSSSPMNMKPPKKRSTRTTSSFISKLLKISSPSKFGRGQERVYDPKVRLCREIAGSRIELDPPLDALELRLLAEELLVQLVPGSDPNGWNIRTELHKLMIYEQGGHFQQHVDSLHGPDHLASLVIVSDIEHEGGNLVVSFMNSNKVVLDCSSSAGDERGRWIAFYTDCPHMVEPVTKGVRVLLQYDVYVGATEPSRSMSPEVNPFATSCSSLHLDKMEKETQEIWKTADDEDMKENRRRQRASPPPMRVKLQLQALHEALRGVLLNLDDTNLDDTKATDDLQDEDGGSDSRSSSDEDGGSKWAKVGLLLHHRYRATHLEPRRNGRGAVRAPYFLKGGDAIGYESLIQEFKVELVPLLIDVEVWYAEDPMEINMRAAPLLTSWPDDAKNIPILLPGESNLCSSVSELYHLYEEEMGNEPQYGEDTYVGGCLLISRHRCK